MSAYAEGAIPTILVRGQGPTDSTASIASHSAQQQPSAPPTRPDGLRADREYPRQFDVENPGTLVYQSQKPKLSSDELTSPVFVCAEWWPEGRGVPHFRPLHANEAETRSVGPAPRVANRPPEPC